MKTEDIPQWLRTDFENGYVPEMMSDLDEEIAYALWRRAGGRVRPAPAAWADGLVCLVVVSVFAGVFLYYAL
jgi:hypothetical protein